MRVIILYEIVGGLFLLSATNAASRLKSFCYFTNWSNKLASFDARFDIRDINATLCSHLVYAYANIDGRNMRLVQSQMDDDNGQLINKRGRYFDFNKLKKNHPDLVTLLSVGGIAARNGGFVQIVKTPENMKLFSKNVATYLRDRDFDGIDIDWEWPGQIYRNKYTQLLQIMRREFETEAALNSKPRLLITIAVAVGEETITNSFNISSISRDVDFIQIMAYDFHGPWSDVTSFSAPLFSRVSNPRFNQQLSQAWAVDRWISGGAPRSKLIMGLTSTATSFTLSNRSLTDVGSPVDGPGKQGPYLGSEGHVTYYRVCEMIKNGAMHHWDEEQRMAFAYMADQWVGYGNPKSMKEKVKFAYSRGIAGVMIWTLDHDDFLGHYCNAGEYPLLTAIYNAIIELAPQQNQLIADASSSTTHSTTPIHLYLHNDTNQNKMHKLKNFCYFTNWSNKLASFDARFDIRDINATLCSHLVYAYANIDGQNIKLIPSQNDDDNGQLINKRGRYFDFNKLKINYPDLVTLLSVGGTVASNGGFVQIVNTPENMKLFSKNVATYLRDRDFDGIDIDWEWPGVKYRNKYTQLLQIMRREFEKEAARTSKPRLLITIAVAVGEETITNSYNISSISSDVDYIQIMAYDFHGPWSGVTSFSAPLFSRASNPRFNQQLSQAWAVDRWISGGAPRSKLVMGLTSTATSFTLSNRSLTDVGSPVEGAGKQGPYLGSEGHVTYFRVCEMIKYGATYRWDDEQKMAYAYIEDQWVGYGNPKSMKEKVEFAYSRGIGGVMFWTLDQDDFLGYYCNAGEYPLLTAIYNTINELAPQQNKLIADASPSTAHSTTPIHFYLHNETNQNKTPKLKNFCYFTNWSNKLASFDARFNIRDINATLCSHLIYAFANIDDKNIKLIPSQNDDDNGQLINKRGRYFDFNKLKIEHPKLVTLLSIGGAAARNGKFVQIVKSPENMKLFSKNVATYLRDRDFDGIDIDWEWPGEIYRNKYTQLLQVMRREFEKEAARTSKPRLLITIAVAVGEETITNSYNISSISSDVDFIQIMSYDFHGPWSDVTSFSAPLFSRASNPRFNQQLSQAWAVDRWISGGAPRSKLIMGLTSTATSFTLSNRSLTDVGSPVESAGKQGPYLGSEGHVTYFRVCEMIKNGATYRWDKEQKMAYAYIEDQWMGYGNPKSMKEKVKFAYSRGIGGVMFWTLDRDDFLGHYCNAGEYPLLTAIYNAINALAPQQNKIIADASPSTTHSTTPIHFYLHNETNQNKTPKLKNFCYFTNWSNKLASFDARFDIRDINATLCSHLIYAFASIDDKNIKLIPSQNDDDNGQLINKRGRYFDFNKLKIEHPKLVTHLSIGGAYARNGGFVQIVNSPENMKLFSKNVARYLRDRDFDGIVIDWEWPLEIYRNKYTQLLQIMRREFVKEASRTSKPRLLITIAVAVGEENITNSYNISSISSDVDYIQIMAYDFHGPWSDVTSFSAPLFSRVSNPRFNQQLSQAWAVDRWISGGAPRSKLIMGLTSTATSFTLSNRSLTDVGSPVEGAGRGGPYLGSEGHVTYYRVCEMIKNGATYRWDDEQKMAYAYMEDQWVGYGNPKSMKEKVKFAYSRGIGGVMFWTLDQDDFHGHYCNAGKYPLLTAINNAIIESAPKKNKVIDDTTSSTTHSDISSSTTHSYHQMGRSGSSISELSRILFLFGILFSLF